MNIAVIKSISNELDITCHVFASQLSGHCDVTANRLWRHQQNVKRASETRGDVWRSSFLTSFMDSLCRVRNKIIYALLRRTVYALECYFGVYFPRCCATREINTKITLSWAHKKFPTRVHTLFYIYFGFTVVKVRSRMSNYMPYKTMDVIIYPCPIHWIRYIKMVKGTFNVNHKSLGVVQANVSIPYPRMIWCLENIQGNCDLAIMM